MSEPSGIESIPVTKPSEGWAPLSQVVQLQVQVQQQLKYIQNQRQQLQDLRDRIAKLEQLTPFLQFQPDIQWLMENRSERMDPTVPIFDQGRADFHLDRYVFAAQYCREQRVADIACGTGYGSEYLSRTGGAAQVFGVDICAEATKYAASRHGGPRITFLTAPGEATGLIAASCDVVVSFETIEHVPDDQALLSEFARILAPGGRLICSTPNLWPLAIAPHHVREYDREQFLASLSNHFRVVELWNQNSGTSFEFNRGQPRGILPTTDDNHQLAECFIAVCERP
ncbi:MAG: methyltransferase domain-containing protein [Planctomycetaceae bacterium]|nr:methyltransferase domain-containing protein [Planctomycetaceae bacterium]